MINLRQTILGACDWYLDKYCKDLPEAPQSPHKRPKANKTATHTADASSAVCAASYELWKAYKLGNGERVTAPRGKGKEWKARLYCENRLQTAERFYNSGGTTRQLRTGSWNDRRDRMKNVDRRQAWAPVIDISKTIIESYHDDFDGMYWEGAREMIDEAWGEARYKLYLVRG